MLCSSIAGVSSSNRCARERGGIAYRAYCVLGGVAKSPRLEASWAMAWGMVCWCRRILETRQRLAWWPLPWTPVRHEHWRKYGLSLYTIFLRCEELPCLWFVPFIGCTGRRPKACCFVWEAGDGGRRCGGPRSVCQCRSTGDGCTVLHLQTVLHRWDDAIMAPYWLISHFDDRAGQVTDVAGCQKAVGPEALEVLKILQRHTGGAPVFISY